MMQKQFGDLRENYEEKEKSEDNYLSYFRLFLKVQ